ncbi:MAG: hypothetical protein H6831_06360 [Planctomycetes bacterium]|nr:hypothetical protein [Planctomycetota bacterium]MCB9904011.1 hypothetical protein [Planctomycetota bacterium]
MSKRVLLAGVLLAAPVFAASSLLQQAEPVLKESDHQKIGKLIKDCVDAKLDGGRGQVEAETELLDGLQKWEKKKQLDGKEALAFPLDLERSIWFSNDYSKVKGVKKGKVATVEFTTSFSEGAQHEYAVWVPSKYNPRESYALVLAIPDAGEKVDAHITEQWTFGDFRDGAIIAAVPMPDDASLWAQIGESGKPGGAALTLTLLGELTRNYAVDFDRIYLAGRGAGVAAAVQLASLFPDRFAGVIGRAGDVGETSTENFRGVPTFFAGAGSRATAFAEACKASGADNCRLAPEGKEEDIWAWMAENPRRPYASEIHLLAGSPFPNKAYWVELPPSDGSVVNRVHGKADRATNTVTVEAEGARYCFLYFNDQLVDLDQPVKVVINGVEHVDTLPRNLRTLTTWLYRSGSDPGKSFVASKRYDIPAKEKSE